MILCLLAVKNRKRSFDSLDKKEHPFRKLYFLAAMAVEKTGMGVKSAESLDPALKKILVKENVERENYLYLLKKLTNVFLIVSAVLIIGLMSALAEYGEETVKSLERDDHGGSVKVYDLEAQYRGKRQDVSLSIAAEKMTADEVLEFFHSSFPQVKKIMLAGNESADNVTESLNFISEYEGISIYWEISDRKAVGYNGEIRKEALSEEPLLISISAVFTMDNVSESFEIPLSIKVKSRDRQELLLEEIIENIEENNSVNEKEVRLPEEIEGYRIIFRTVKGTDSFIFLIFGVIAALAVLIFYDRGLEDKLKKRQKELAYDYPELVTRLSLLYEAGLSIRAAFERILQDEERKKKKDRYVYREIRLMLEKIKSGVSEREAYAQFGKRCGSYSYIKLGNILEQNLHKGTKGMKTLLKQEVQSCFEERKRLARKKGEAASTKMLIPMVIMLLIVIVIIAVPAFINMRI